MNRTKKRRNKKLAGKHVKKTRPIQESSPILGGLEQTLTIQQAIDLAVQHHQAGDLHKAEGIYQQILQADPDQPIVLHLLGLIAYHVGKNDIAFDSISKALTIKPDYAEAHCNLGSVLKALGKLDDAEISYRKAITIKPDYAEANYNLGNALKFIGKFDEAMLCYRKAITIKPDYAEAYLNLSVTLQGQGKLDGAVKNFHKAITIKPDYAEAYLNLGVAFHEFGELGEAASSYKKAIAINPGLAEAHYNLHALMLDIDDMTTSINHLKQSVDIEPINNLYRFTLGILLDYSCNSQEAATHFDIVEVGSNLDRARLDAWRYVKSINNEMPPVVGSSVQAFELGIKASIKEGLVLEFGVRFGTSIRQIAKLAKQEVHGFDSFEGLPEAWHNEPKGSYSTRGIIPSVPDNVTLHNGWFEETLPNFVDQYQGPIRFMNIDCDIYSSTKTIFELLAKQITHGTVIVFDEYIGNANWREDEFKAFQESVLRNGWEYEYICFSFFTKQVVVRIS